MTEDQEELQAQRSAMLAELFESYGGRGGNFQSVQRSGRGLDPVGRGSRIFSSKSDSASASDLDQATDGQHGAAWKPPPGIYRSKLGTGPSRFDPKPLGDVLGQVSSRRGWGRSISVGTVIGQWESIVGDVVAQHCPVVSFEEGRLVVQADSSAWAQQLQLLLPQIHKRIDDVVGPKIVEQVIVRGPRAPSWKRGPRSVPGRGPRDTYG